MMNLLNARLNSNPQLLLLLLQQKLRDTEAFAISLNSFVFPTSKMFGSLATKQRQNNLHLNPFNNT
jgi:hypothetical protein